MVIGDTLLSLELVHFRAVQEDLMNGGETHRVSANAALIRLWDRK